MSTFGNSALTGTSDYPIEDRIVGGKFQMGAIGGPGVSITAKLKTVTTAYRVKCAIYNDDRSLLANSVTEERTINPQAYTATTFNFGATKPTLVENAWYWIAIWAEATAGTANVAYKNSTGAGIKTDSETYDGFPNPWAGETAATNFLEAIYCTYTEAGGAALTLALGDSIGLSEALKFDIGMKLGDTQGFSEALTTQSTFNLALADTETLSESLASGLLMTFNLALADTIALEEVIVVDLTITMIKKKLAAMPRKIGWPTPMNVGMGA